MKDEWTELISYDWNVYFLLFEVVVDFLNVDIAKLNASFFKFNISSINYFLLFIYYFIGWYDDDNLHKIWFSSIGEMMYFW